MLLKGPLGYGLRDARGMIIHHFATLALILLSYGEPASLPEAMSGGVQRLWCKALLVVLQCSLGLSCAT